MTHDPYSPPGSRAPESAELPDSCPKCGALLAKGWTEGSLRWFEEGSSSLERFKGGKHIAGPSSFSITLRPVQHPSHHCRNCGLTIVLPR